MRSLRFCDENDNYTMEGREKYVAARGWFSYPSQVTQQMKKNASPIECEVSLHFPYNQPICKTIHDGKKAIKMTARTIT